VEWKIDASQLGQIILVGVFWLEPALMGWREYRLGGDRDDNEVKFPHFALYGRLNEVQFEGREGGHARN
jgi:hypothetical protein